MILKWVESTDSKGSYHVIPLALPECLISRYTNGPCILRCVGRCSGRIPGDCCRISTAAIQAGGLHWTDAHATKAAGWGTKTNQLVGGEYLQAQRRTTLYRVNCLRRRLAA
jgi:hypothetical protein